MTAPDAGRACRFDDLSLAGLRRRRSAKWRTYEPDVLPAWVAEMDFPLAPEVRTALREAVDLGDCGYAISGQLPEAFAQWAADRLKWTVNPAHICTVADVMTGVRAFLGLFTAPGDPVVVNTPIYPPFFEAVAETGRQLVTSPLAAGPVGHYELDLDRLEADFAAGARAYLLCNPHNPTGRVFGRSELEHVAMLAETYGVAVVADEIHAPLTLPGAVHTPYGSVTDQAVVATSASKAWNVPGLKCALLIAGTAAAQARIDTLPKSVPLSTGLLGVTAAVAAFRGGQAWLDDVLDQLDRNRRLLGELLAARLPGVGYRPPEASYLGWLDCRTLDLGADPAAVFLERGRVALNSGPTFGEEGEGFVRVNMATSAAILADVVDRMARAVRAGSAW